MSRLYVKPAPARAVPVPEKGGQLLAESGEWVPHNAYWQRRLNDKDVEKIDPPAAEPVQAAPAAEVKPAAKTAKKGSDA